MARIPNNYTDNLAAIEAHKVQYEALKKALDTYRESENSGSKRMFLDDAKEDYIVDHIEQLKKQVAYYEQVLEKIKTIPFKKGQFAIHKEHGNCIIQSVRIEDINKNSDTPNVMISYQVAHGAGDFSSATRVGTSGVVWASEEDLVPYNDMSKTLYTKDS